MYNFGIQAVFGVSSSQICFLAFEVLTPLIRHTKSPKLESPKNKLSFSGSQKWISSLQNKKSIVINIQSMTNLSNKVRRKVT